MNERWVLIACLGLALVSSASSAKAAEETSAREHFDRGLLLVDQTRYEEAIVEFERAQAISPHASVLYNIGMAYANARRYAKALAVLRAYLASPASEQDALRVREAQARIARLEPLVARLRVHVEPPSARVYIDGQVASGREEIALDAGAHALTVLADGYLPQEQALHFTAGERRSLVLRLQQALAQPAATRATPDPQPHPPARALRPAALQPLPPPVEGHRSKLLVVSLTGAGAALAALTVGLVVDNQARHDEWESSQSALNQRWLHGPRDADLSAQQEENDERADRIKLQDEVAVGTGVACAAFLIAAAAVWLSEPPPARRVAARPSMRSGAPTLMLQW